MSVRRGAEKALREALARMPVGAETGPGRAVLAEQLAALAAPLRIAVAGRVSSGKSTLVNALVGAPVAATGTAPVTFAVSVLRHSDAPSLTVHYTDGRQLRSEDTGRLADFTARDVSGSAAAGIGHVELFGPYPCLLRFDLVDTPGFDSPFTQDNENAMRAIGVTRESVTQASAAQLLSADAVVAVLNVGVSGPDADVLRRFHAEDAGYRPTPITSIAVLTKVEFLWPGEIGQQPRDPRETARRHAARIENNPETARLFHRVLPVCTKIAAATGTLTDQDFDHLTELAQGDPIRLDQRLGHHTGFVQGEGDGLALTTDQRRGLAVQLTPYGISLACRLVREGADTLTALNRELGIHSGMDELRRELTERFADRSDLIKLGRTVETVRAIPRALPDAIAPRTRAAIEEAVERVTDLERDELAFAELVVLRRYYEGELRLPPEEAAELKRISGDQGRSVAARLGRPSTDPLADLDRTAQDRIDYWRRTPTLYAPGGRAAARVATRRYEELAARVRQARAILEENQ